MGVERTFFGPTSSASVQSSREIQLLGCPACLSPTPKTYEFVQLSCEDTRVTSDYSQKLQLSSKVR
eukprot:6460359-Amphidinium_carterae.1